MRIPWAQQSQQFFEVVTARYEKGPIILTSNRSFAEWGALLGDEVLATALLDRLLHHAEVLTINGRSYRMKDRLELPLQPRRREDKITLLLEPYHVPFN